MFSERFPKVFSGWRALRRDWHSGELRLLAGALFIAVAAVTSVGFLADRVSSALTRDSAQMLGADLVIQGNDPLPPDFYQQAQDLSLATATTVQFPSMVSYGDATQLVAVKAVTPNYPLRGQLRVADSLVSMDQAADQAPAAGTVWVDPQMLNMLGVAVGDQLEVGLSELTIKRIITYEPDRGLQFVNVAPRIMLALADLPATGLLAPGSRVQHQLLVAGEPTTLGNYANWLDKHLQPGQKINTLEGNRPELQQALERADQFLTLVALLTVMIAAVAVALAARRFSLRHRDGIAIMRCLGASKSQLSGLLWTEFLSLGVLASVAGTLGGYVAHQGLVMLAANLIGADLPAAAWMPAWQGLATGMLLLLGFALPPLAGLPRVAPARILRREADIQAIKRWPAYLLGVCAFAILISWVAGNAMLSVVVSLGFLAAFAIFALLAYTLVGVGGRVRTWFVGFPALRFALAGMSQRRALTVTQLCALAMGLMILLLLAITRTDLLLGWQNTVPPDAPNTFLINIQTDQVDEVHQRLRQDGLAAAALSPMVRGRLVAINQQAVSADDYEEERARHMVQREFNLSWADQLPSSNRITQGRWLNPDQAEASLENKLAKTLGVQVGDSLTFDVAGQPVQVVVSGLREVQWDSFQVNFFALLSPAALKQAPATYITSFHLPAKQSHLTKDLVAQFPNLTVFDVGAILGQVQRVLDQVIQAVQLLFLFTVAAGILVLGAALFATRDERMHEVAVLRVLGASGRQLRLALYIELLLLGALAGILAAGGATGIAMLLASQVFHFSLAYSWWPMVAGVVGGVSAAMLGGGLALKGVLSSPPLVTLRAS
ncbi:FtsX-like permease family protein [Alcaligenaceae bacterium]|nr:FtsX-like permease family protein [Alcaligenaceae bacterium]